jgi:hypothetical protein
MLREPPPLPPNPEYPAAAPPAAPPAWSRGAPGPDPLPQLGGDPRLGALPPLPSWPGGPGPALPNRPSVGGGFIPAATSAQLLPEAAAQSTAGGGSRNTCFFGNISLDFLAMQGLRELAGSLFPNVPLETTGDVARFITKLHDALEVFCRCFIPLREGYSQFVSSFDLERAFEQRSAHRSQAYRAVEMAQTPEAVAAALLDFRDRSFDAPKAIENIFADLMVHQMALLEGVMRGVRSLLDELSPEQFEHDESLPRPLGLPVGRYKALWQAYRERYDELSGEQRAFARIFGPEFTAAYREYQNGRGEGGEKS